MRIKRAVSTLLTAAMLFTGVSFIPAVQADTGSPVAKVDFDTEENYTLKGGAALVEGRSGKALSLDGASGNYADISAVADALAGVTGDFSIGVWVNPNTITTWSRIYDFGNGSSGTYVFLTPSNGAVPRLAVTTNGNTAEQQVDSAQTITTGIWHNITITRKDGTSTFYIDGIATGTTTSLNYKFSDIGKMQNYYLGKSQFDADPYFNGMIDDLEIYDYALDETQVQTLAAEAYERIKNEAILQNNCYTVNTNFYDENGTEIFAYNSSDTEMSISGKSIGTDAAEFTLNNAMGEDVSGIRAYTAVYNNDGVLQNVKIKNVSTDEITSNAQKISVPIENPDKLSNVKLLVWNNIKPLNEKSGSDSIKVVSTIENDTADAGAVSAPVYAVSADGEETKLSDGESKTLASLKSAEFTSTVTDIPSGTVKLVVKVQTDDKSYDAATLYVGIDGPVAAPKDSNTTTNGAHDPSIVKFDGDSTYYVYSSHHLIFTSEDLINWKKYDFTSINAKDMSPKTYNYITNNYTGTTMNGTYWAPDVIYKEGDDHPYWMYISVSCGLGGMNSVISLMKSDNPLFWADEKSDIIDAGVVIATKNGNGKTNAIDANIYTDTDGQQYFIWGSFWGGIQSVRLKADGFAEGVDYTSDASILSSCKALGTSVFTQKNGAAGPEGAWMLNHGDYRYMYTSYGWLGSNYNTRVARASLSQAFSNNMGTQLTDANNVSMGGQYSSGSLSNPSGYKLIGSYRLGDGAASVTKDSSTGNYYYERTSDDAHIYYGSGHNSVINIADEAFYVSHVRKDAVEGAAILQVRKMLFTSDGWPVVSPVSYAGEKEQALPKDMLVGTYDLASVGHTKMDGSQINTGTNPNRNYDLPVISSKVTLNADGTLADNLGTWSFDGDHTITITFAKDGDTSKDEFYKSGDVMTMYALFGYDKDEQRAVAALTGTDQNHITQFAAKPIVNSYKTPAKTIENTEPVSIAKSTGGNPELGFDSSGNVVYAGDPAATVIDTDSDGTGDTVYIIAGHDTASNESYVMPEWVAYTSKDMTNWEYKGTVMKATDVSWRSNDTSAWASQMVPYTNKDTGITKYYLYFCTWDKTSSGKQSIGVAVADKPEGPYTDALGEPLVRGTFTTPESASHDDIDPTVFIDTDSEGVEHRYLAWGNTRYYVCELNEDMTSIKDIDNDGEIVMHKDIKERKIKSMTGSYTEGPWLYKRDGKYYMFFAMNWREEMAYAMCDEPMGRYDYKQTIMPPNATANTNHPSVIDFNGKTYFIYHNGALPHGSGFRRSVCVQELQFDENGYVYPLTETSIGLDGTASVLKTAGGKYAAHDAFRNPNADANYPLTYPVTLKSSEEGYNTAWEIEKAKYVPDGENADYYVSIQSVNKPGLYIKSLSNGVTLTQDADGNQGEAMTFKTIKGIDDANGVSFESVLNPGYYLTASETGITLSTTGKNAVFYIENATQKDETTIDTAPVEPDPEPAEDISTDFNNASDGAIMSLGVTEQLPNASNAGVYLYVGARTSGGSTTTGWSIEAGSGVDSTKALVMSSGRWANGNRAARMQLTTPPMPNGSTVTGEFKVKLGTDAELYYGDSTTTQGTNNITSLLSTSDWSSVKVTITNDNDTYTRKIYVNDTETASDYVGVFPVFWGKPSDTTAATYKVYFDNVEIKTITQ